MDAWLDKVYSCRSSLAIYDLIFLCKRCQHEISVVHVIQGDVVLIHQAHSIDKFAVIRIIGVGEDIV
jgi:hypothetical protein